MNNVECGEVTEGGGGEDAVAVVQRADVHHAQVQQLQHTRGQRSAHVVQKQPVTLKLCVQWRLRCVTYLCDLDVGFLGELRNQEVLSVRLGFHLRVQLQPGDGRLRTQIPVQRLQEDTKNTQVSTATQVCRKVEREVESEHEPSACAAPSAGCPTCHRHRR